MTADYIIAWIVSYGIVVLLPALMLSWLTIQSWRKFNVVLESKVKGFEGECKIVWLNTNAVSMRLEGLSGFFKKSKRLWGVPFPVGREFHGLITEGGVVISTARDLEDA